ncbi:MAG TPA: ketoacyl-ACP synthase III [Aeromonadales bacterium]|nr:ketoacyl-ACP synthase III [Aeromonadales bacterium]
MIGIEAIGCYIPQNRIDNNNRIAEFDLDENFLIQKIGMQHLAVKDSGEETSDLCVKAFKDLQNKTSIQTEQLDCIVVCTQNPDGHGLPHTSAIVHEKLDLSDHCAVFDISLGCSGFVYGMSIIQGFMQANGFEKGILFTADPYSKIIDKQDKNTSLLFGDGASATLISNTPKWKTGRFLFGSYGKSHPAIKINEDNKLTMNGRAVFNFSAITVPNNIADMLALNALTIDDVEYFALHQGSRFIIDTLRRKLKVDEQKLPFLATDYGNTVSSSIPLILGGLDKSYKTIVIAGFGVGLSWASTVLFEI